MGGASLRLPSLYIAPTASSLLQGQRPDVDFSGVPLALRPNYLGSHPENRTLHVIRCIISVNVVSLLRNAKVRDLASSIKVKQDIVSLEISVQNSFSMEIC